jgi:hypothetical protein
MEKTMVKPTNSDEQIPVGATETPPVIDANTVTPPAPGPSATPEEKTRYQQRIDQLTAARRTAEERNRMLEEKLARFEGDSLRVPTSTGTGRPVKTELVGTMSRDDWNDWHDEDPAAAIEYLADIKADQKAKTVISQIEQQTQVTQTIEEVYKAHPELKDVMQGVRQPSEVPFWEVYDEVAREMPDARFLAKGPIIVMKEAERRMKERIAEAKEKEIATNAAVEENSRQTRVGASHTIGTKVSPPVSTVKLSPEEESVARKMRLTPEEYMKYK